MCRLFLLKLDAYALERNAQLLGSMGRGCCSDGKLVVPLEKFGTSVTSELLHLVRGNGKAYRAGLARPECDPLEGLELAERSSLSGIGGGNIELYGLSALYIAGIGDRNLELDGIAELGLLGEYAQVTELAAAV